MGLEIVNADFGPGDVERFRLRLDHSLDRLREVLEAPEFGLGEATVGAELELVLVDSHWNPAFQNLELLEALSDPRFTPEVDRFNIELNCQPLPLAGDMLGALHRQFADALQRARAAAEGRGVGVAMIGSLPTLTDADLGLHALTPLQRYQALNASLSRVRQRPIRLRIKGEDSLDRTVEHITYEGANTSMQLHLRVAPHAFAKTYNAAQLASAPALAVAANSPLFLQRRLWDETRIVVFKQAADDRCAQDMAQHTVPRVDFGTRWLERGIYELFEDNVRFHEPLLPVVDDEDLDAPLAAPPLAALRLHQGTVWSWNRGIYDDASGGHLRIEFRALPAGPSAVDMVANAAYLLGLTLAFASGDMDPRELMPFDTARSNFYRAAQYGLNAELIWPTTTGQLAHRDVRQLAAELLPVARDGLVAHGVDGARADAYLAIIEQRLARGQTGARWQRAWLAERGGPPRLENLRQMMAGYQARSQDDQPVHTWGLQ